MSELHEYIEDIEISNDSLRVEVHRLRQELKRAEADVGLALKRADRAEKEGQSIRQKNEDLVKHAARVAELEAAVDWLQAEVYSLQAQCRAAAVARDG